LILFAKEPYLMGLPRGEGIWAVLLVKQDRMSGERRGKKGWLEQKVGVCVFHFEESLKAIFWAGNQRKEREDVML
jgi:hypothetical protein